VVGDRVGNATKLTKHRAIDGTTYTFVKTNNRQRFEYTFDLTTMKAEELKAFLKVHRNVDIRWQDHYGVVRVGRLTDEETPFQYDRKSSVTVELKIEGEEL
jgi:phage-related protein